MLIVLVSLILSGSIYAQKIAFDKGDPDIGSFKDYKIESCVNVQGELNKCSDGSISYSQPRSTGINGYEGKCGQTAAANVTQTLCGGDQSPSSIDKMFRDITPGILPTTLKNGLNKLFKHCNQQKSWQYLTFKTEEAYLQSFDNTKENPIAILIRNPGGRLLHWVTIIDKLGDNKENCSLIINHWGGQYQVPCKTISKWSRGVKDSYGAVLKQYTQVKLL